MWELFFDLFDDNDNLLLGNITHSVGPTKLSDSEIETFFVDRIYPFAENQLAMMELEEQEIEEQEAING